MANYKSLKIAFLAFIIYWPIVLLLAFISHSTIWGGDQSVWAKTIDILIFLFKPLPFNLLINAFLITLIIYLISLFINRKRLKQ